MRASCREEAESAGRLQSSCVNLSTTLVSRYLGAFRRATGERGCRLLLEVMEVSAGVRHKGHPRKGGNPGSLLPGLLFSFLKKMENHCHSRKS